ncbi:MAG: sigma-E factor negative regulatory protein [Burkholderiales bacterium]
MSERISSLIDGELGSDAEIDQVLRELGEHAPHREEWNTYHLIGDALRATHGAGGLSREGFSKRLAAEPTVLAPRRKPAPSARPMRWSLPIAASIAAVVFVGWFASSMFESPGQASPLAGSMARPSLVSTQAGGKSSPSQSGFLSTQQQVPVLSAATPPSVAVPLFIRPDGMLLPPAQGVAAAGADALLDDYVWAHQRYSPASLMHDVAPYVRLVSGRGAGQ